jgi:kinesin family protein 5
MEKIGISDASMITSVLYLVDLAGSERVKKSKVSGDRLDEAISINSSLTALGIQLNLINDFIGKCIHALTDIKTTFVPFRDSKLTRILQDSLGGNSKTSLVVNIGPSAKNIEETLSSLYFGSRAMKVQNKPIINRQQDYYV